jgi:predicted glycosyltransferase
VRAWIDIDNPPQVQYLTPFVDAFSRRGWEVLVTARDNGATHRLLAQRDLDFVSIGSSFGVHRMRKIAGVLSRALRLRSLVRAGGGASFLLCSSRSSAIASRSLGIPAFVVCDYEHVELCSYRFARAHLLFPDAIGGEVFAAKGFPRDHLLPFNGLKEDITFGNLPERIDVPRAVADPVRILVRPPAEESHYFDERTRSLLFELLGRLATAPDLEVVYTPRDPVQARHLGAHDWLRPPVVLTNPVPVLDLFASVDWVVSAGGTMLREAAYLGVPAVGLLQGELGRVDEHLASIGAIALVTCAAELDRIDWREPPRSQPIPHHPRLLEELAETVERRVRGIGSEAEGPE